MRKLLLYVLLMTPLGCSPKHSPAPPKPLSPCVVPEDPKPPVLHPSFCGDQVCLPPGEAVALAWYRLQVDNITRALKGCPTTLVVRVPQPKSQVIK